MRRLLSIVETLTHSGYFFQSGDFYPVQRLLLSAETLSQCRDFELVRRLLSNAETFICSENFIQ